MSSPLYYYNRQDYPIAFNYKGTRITLWQKDEILKDSEGNPILDPMFEDVKYGLYKLGLTPKLVDAPPPAPKPKVVPLPETVPPVVPNAPIPPPATSKVSLTPTVLELITKDKITAEDLNNPEKMQVRIIDGLWVFMLDNYSNANPAGIKQHIRMTFGKEVLEKVKFDTQ